MPERPGCSQGGAAGTICKRLMDAPAAASTRESVGLGIERVASAEPDQCRPSPLGDASPRRTPLAAIS